MVCNRCIRVVNEELTKLGLDVRRIVLGEAEVSSKKPVNTDAIRRVLSENGFELIEDKRRRTIEQIKLKILEVVQRDLSKEPLRQNFSDYLSNHLHHDYHSLSTLFSSVEGITIEQYIILQRIERAKELLKYGELTLSEISDKLGYSSVAHLSAQFKKVTGLTPSAFKGMRHELRIPLDRVK
ncbi:MAG: helix-turn-helix transcriptional regulator [Ignavibacteriales bacterium]|nr:helix-turn-helix transcriptional regulator [Ignavibacteriales bacterium]